MSNNTREKQVARKGQDQKDDGASWWTIGLGVAAGAAAVAGGIYALSKLEGSQKQPPAAQHTPQDVQDQSSCQEHNVLTVENIADAVSRQAVPPTPAVTDLNSFLDDVHVRYIVTKKEEFVPRFYVLTNVFNKLHGAMTAIDSYYERYFSRLILRPEEFKIYTVISVPDDHLNPEESGIVIEPKHGSFVQLRAGAQYQNITLRDSADSITIRSWLDDRSYILRSKFISWFQSVVDRALKRLENSVRINDHEFKLTTSFNEGSYTLWITSTSGFRCDLNLVPALRFFEERWLDSSEYRAIPPDCDVDYWLAVNRNMVGNSEDRSWLLDMYEQEKKFINDSVQLRQALRLLKKLRDAQQMTYIENYHIETLFLWKCESSDTSFWQRNVATVFKAMLQEFYEALQERKISYFWKKSYNLIEKVPGDILEGYAAKLKKIATEIECGDYTVAAEYLLTDSENTVYKDLPNRTSCRGDVCTFNITNN